MLVITINSVRVSNGDGNQQVNLSDPGKIETTPDRDILKFENILPGAIS